MGQGNLLPKIEEWFPEYNKSKEYDIVIKLGYIARLH
jgi:hypothetical protein